MSQQLAAEANKALLDRIANGGKKMPPFRHLAGDEVTALVEYVKTLAGIPAGEQHPRTVTESVVRAGEHLVKGTCHVCHPATGPGPSHMMMYMRGVIPSLASMPQQMSPAAVLGKVRAGAYGGIGMMAGRRACPCSDTSRTRRSWPPTSTSPGIRPSPSRRRPQELTDPLIPTVMGWGWL